MIRAMQYLVDLYMIMDIYMQVQEHTQEKEVLLH